MDLGATVNSTRYSQCAKPASFTAVIYHVYAKLHMLSGMSGICILCQGEWTRNSRFVAPNLRGAIAPSRFGCDESTCFASILRLKMHSDMQLALLFLLLIQMHMKTHCFQRISSKEDILSLKIHSHLALNLYLCSTR